MNQYHDKYGNYGASEYHQQRGVYEKQTDEKILFERRLEGNLSGRNVKKSSESCSMSDLCDRCDRCFHSCFDFCEEYTRNQHPLVAGGLGATGGTLCGGALSSPYWGLGIHYYMASNAAWGNCFMVSAGALTGLVATIGCIMGCAASTAKRTSANEPICC